MDDETLVVYFDGACEPRSPGGWATFGWIAKRDGAPLASGKGLAARGPDATNNVAEYAALLAALRWLGDGDHQGAVEIRSDSQLVIRQMTGMWDCHAEHLPLYQEAATLARQLPGPVTFRWIPRAENVEADALSGEAYREARAGEAGSLDGYDGLGDLMALPLRRDDASGF